MAPPFKIPKRKQLDGSDSAHMLSPLSRLQSGPASGFKTYSDPYRRGGADKVHAGNSVGSLGSRRSGCNSSLHIVVKAQVGRTRPNASTNHGADRGGARPSAPAFSNGWRPRRASDRLLQSDSSPLKVDSASTGGVSVRALDSLAGVRGERHAGSQSRAQAEAVQDTSEQKNSGRNGLPHPPPSKNHQPAPANARTLSSPPSSSSSSTATARSWNLDRTAWRNSGRGRTGARHQEDGGNNNDNKETERERWKEFRDRKTTRRSAVLNLQPKRPRPRPGPSEPIVLSSEEEDEAEDEGGGAKRLKESCARKDESKQEAEHRQVCSSDGDGGGEPAPSFLQLEFTSLHVGPMKASANGRMTITDSGITLPLKGDDDGEVSVVASQVRAYGVWDGGVARGGTLLAEWKGPAPTLLFLWVTDAQANLLQRELSEIQTCNSTGPLCPFVLLVLTEQLPELRAALLASILDMDEYRLGRAGSTSPSPLDWTDGLLLLHSCPPPLDQNLLALLGHREQKSSPSRSTRSGLSSGPQLLPTRLIQYPPAPSKGRITVTKEDVACLDAGQFLNDVIIDFYLKFLMLEGVGGNVAKRTHVFSSFFYKQLSRRRGVGEDDGASVPDRHTRHRRVKTWTRHVDIFTKDFLFVPVNQEAHWYLVVVCFPGLDDVRLEEFQSPTGGSGKAPSALRSQQPPECTLKGFSQDTALKRPCILVMDSLKLSYHENVCRLLREYLQVEWEVRRGTPRLFTPDAVKTFNCRVPQQDNSSDCGLYLLQYAESFLQNPIVHFEPPLRLDQWFPRQRVWQKREEIRSLIMRLHRRQSDDDGPNLTPSR